jgi:hypothetical protein
VSARRLLVLVAIASLGITAAAAIVVLLFGDAGDIEGRILATTFSISAASLLALPGVILLERGDALALGGTNVVLTGTAFVLALALIWLWDDSETLARSLGSTVAVAGASTQWAALTLRRRPRERDAVRLTYFAACALAALLATMIVLAIWAEIDSENYYRLLGALAVLDVFLVVVQPLLRRLDGRVGPREARIVVDDGDHEAVADAVRRLEAAGLRVRVER